VNDSDEEIKLHDSSPDKLKTALDISLALSEPFNPTTIHWKPQAVSGNRALAIAYIDARTVMDRLDETVGPHGWQNELEFHENGTVLCRLRILINGEWLVKADVGGPSEQPDEGDRCKAAASDSLKRAAVLWGIGRYIYRLPTQWCDWDAKAKRFVKAPQLPGWAMPRKASLQTGTKPEPQATASDPANGKPHTMPADGAELERRLADFEILLVKEGVCAAGDLLSHVHQAVARAGKKPGYGPDPSKWPAPAIALAVAAGKAFEQEARAKEKQRRQREERLLAPTNGGRR
jgi:hypothetical protein